MYRAKNRAAKEAEIERLINEKLSARLKLPVTADRTTIRAILNAIDGGCEKIWLNGKEIPVRELALTLNLEYPRSNTND